jgi:2-aminoadipate transaminase
VKTFPFGSGRPDPASFPNRGLAEAAMRILPEMGDELACYPGSLGYEPLRKLMSQRFAHREGVALPVDQIVLTTGSMQAVTLMAQVFVESPGDVIVLEEYSYSGTLGAYRKEKAELVGIPLDEYGMRMDALEGTLDRLVSRDRKPKFIYTLATYQNPTGSIMPLDRRRELLAIAGRFGIPVVEDHCYADTAYEDDHEPALWTLEHDTPVIHIESLSKILGPGIRLGYLAAPRHLLDRILQYRRDGGTSTLSAAIVYEYFREELWSHVDRINTIVREKRDLMFDTLSRFPDAFEWFSRPKGGLFIWVKLPDATDTVACEKLAESMGVDYASGKAFHVYNMDVPYIRLAFGFATHDDIRKGIPILADCIRNCRKTRA